MSWHFLERWLDKSSQHSSLLGKFWITLLVICRILILSSLGDRVYADEQAEFRCNTAQPGCNNVCFNRFSPISHIRFWGIQIIVICLPSIAFLIYTGHKTKVKLEIEKEEQNRNKDTIPKINHQLKQQVNLLNVENKKMQKRMEILQAKHNKIEDIKNRPVKIVKLQDLIQKKKSEKEVSTTESKRSESPSSGVSTDKKLSLKNGSIVGKVNIQFRKSLASQNTDNNNNKQNSAETITITGSSHLHSHGEANKINGSLAKNSQQNLNPKRPKIYVNPTINSNFALYLLSVVLRAVLEFTFLSYQKIHFGFEVPDMVKCDAFPCPGDYVDCFVSRSLEKTMFLNMMFVFGRGVGSLKIKDEGCQCSCVFILLCLLFPPFVF